MKFYISSFFYKLLYLFFIIFKIYLNSINLFCNKIKFFSTKNKTYHQTTIKIPHTLQPTKLVKKKKRKKESFIHGSAHSQQNTSIPLLYSQPVIVRFAQSPIVVARFEDSKLPPSIHARYRATKQQVMKAFYQSVKPLSR